MSKNAVRSEWRPLPIRWRNLEGMFEVVGCTGFTAASGKSAASSSSPPSRRGSRGAQCGQSSVGSPRWHINGFAWPSRQAGSVGGYGTGRQRPSPDRVRHYRSWGRDLGVQYRCGAVMSDGLPPPPFDPEFYMPCVRAGGRLPHSWVEVGRRVSTLDLVSRNELTLLTSAESHTTWSLAAEGLSISVAPLGDCETLRVSHRGHGGRPGRPRCAPGRPHRCRHCTRTGTAPRRCGRRYSPSASHHPTPTKVRVHE